MNDEFGLPSSVTGVVTPAVVDEAPEARLERLRAQAVAQVAAESESETLRRLIAEERARVATGGIPTDTQGFPAEYDKVVVFKGQQKHDAAYVPLGIGGYVIKVPRGQEVIIPSCFTAVLENAVEEITVESQGGLVTRPAHRFPYTVKGKATPDEYKAFQAAQRELLRKDTAAAAA